MLSLANWVDDQQWYMPDILRTSTLNNKGPAVSILPGIFCEDSLEEEKFEDLESHFIWVIILISEYENILVAAATYILVLSLDSVGI